MRFEEQRRGRTFAIYSNAEESQDGWALHATGDIVSRSGESGSDIPAADLAAIRARCSHKLEVTAFYRAFDERGLTFGPAFRPADADCSGNARSAGGVRNSFCGAGKAHDRYQIHPIALDACLQAVAAAAMAANEQKGGLYLPSGLEKLELLGDCRGMAFAHAVLGDGTRRTTPRRLPWIQSRRHALVASRGSRRASAATATAGHAADSFYEIEWLPLPSDTHAPDLPGSWLVLGSERPAAFRRPLKEQGIACTTAQQSDLFVTDRTLTPPRI